MRQGRFLSVLFALEKRAQREPGAEHAWLAFLATGKFSRRFLLGQDELALPGGLQAINRAVVNDFNLLVALKQLLAANAGGYRRYG